MRDAIRRIANETGELEPLAILELVDQAERCADALERLEQALVDLREALREPGARVPASALYQHEPES